MAVGRMNHGRAARGAAGRGGGGSAARGIDPDPGGALSGAIAHDLNNLLTAILGHAEVALTDAALTGQTHADLREVVRAARRAALLARQLVTLPRAASPTATVIDLRGVVASMATMLQPLVGEGIELRADLSLGPLDVVADGAEVEMIILNLALNARDAMAEGGVLALTAGQDPRPEERDWAALTVSDSGIGMDDAIRSRAFEPFFTTKPPGRGSGLGLASVAAVAERNGWPIELDSAPGRGTRVGIRIPLAMSVSGSAGAAAAQSHRGSEQVLVVEPDPGVRAIVARTLGAAGYAVILADGPEEAARQVAEHQGVVDLIVAAGASDLDASRAARQVAAGLGEIARVRVLQLTPGGHPLRRADDPQTTYLPKPFTPDELARSVRTSLDAPLSRARQERSSGGDVAPVPPGRGPAARAHAGLGRARSERRARR